MRRDEFPIVHMAIKDAVVKALKEVKAEIHEAGILDHHSDEIEVALVYGKVEAIIEQKIKEIGNERDSNQDKR